MLDVGSWEEVNKVWNISSLFLSLYHSFLFIIGIQIELPYVRVCLSIQYAHRKDRAAPDNVTPGEVFNGRVFDTRNMYLFGELWNKSCPCRQKVKLSFYAQF